MPVGDIPGWHQVFADDFTKNAPLGSFGTLDNNELVYEGDHGGKWKTYPDGWPCDGTGPTFANCYEPAQVLSVHDSVLDYWLHNTATGPAGATLTPQISSDPSTHFVYQTYGRFAARFKVVYEDSRRLDQYHLAWLLWPISGANLYAESDFPEGDLSATSVCAFAHYGGGAQDAFCAGIDLSQWHTYVQEWKGGERKYWIDGNLIGTERNQVYSEGERWELQTEAHAKAGDATSGHLLADWVTVYAPG